MIGGGVGAGWGDYGGGFRNAPSTTMPKRQQIESAPAPGIDAGPSTPPKPPPPQNMGGGINVGRTSKMGILPSAQDPYRTYGTVSGGRMTPPQNPYGQNQPIRFTPGGEYGGNGPGPINTGPTPPSPIPPPITPMPNIPMGQPPPMTVPPGAGPRDYNMGQPQIPLDTGPSVPPPPNPYLERGGFTGGQMPPNIQSETSGASTGYYSPPPMIPNMPPMDTPRGRGGLGQMYGGAGPSLSGSFKRGLFY